MACLMCLLLGPQGPGPGTHGPGPGARDPAPRAHGPGPRIQGLGPRAQGPGPRTQGPGPGARDPGPRAPGPGPKVHRFFRTTYCARILIEGARFPPFGFAITEISSSSNEYASFCQEDLSWHDSDRGRSVSPFRVGHSGDKPRSLEVPRRESRSEIN